MNLTDPNNELNVSSEIQVPSKSTELPPPPPASNEQSYEPKQRTYFQMLLHNRAQTNSISAGVVLMIVGGIHMGWAIWRPYFSPIKDFWFVEPSFHFFLFIITSWWAAAIVGLIAGAVTVNTRKKKTLYIICIGLVHASSIVLIAWDFLFEAIVCARLLSGFGHGLIYIPLLCQASENGNIHLRGRVVALINFAILLGMFIYTLCNYIAVHLVSAGFSNDRLIGIICLAIALLSMMLNLFYTNETVPFLIQHNDMEKAMINMTHLRKEPKNSTNLKYDFNEFQQMIDEDSKDTKNIFTQGNLKPLWISFCARILSFLTNNYILNLIQITITWQRIGSEFSQISAMYLTFIRFFMSILALFLSDIIPRRKYLLFSIFFTSFVLLIIGILLNILYVNDNINTTEAISMALVVFFPCLQLTAGFGIDSSQEIILSESFSLGKRAWSIMFVTGLEYLMQILAIGIFANVGYVPGVVNSVTLISSGLIILIGISFYQFLPETSNLSLRKSRKCFNSKKL